MATQCCIMRRGLWPHIACTIAFLLLLFVQPQVASASPASLLAMRNNRTYVYTLYILNFINLDNLPIIPFFSPEGTDISIYTKEMNIMYAHIAQRSVQIFFSEPKYLSFKHCKTQRGAPFMVEHCAHFYLRASAVRDCASGYGSCCPWYWVTDDVPADLPLANVDPRHFFWDGTKALNGFFTNFSSLELDDRDCSDTTHSYIKYFLASDPEGAWVSTPSHALTVISEREIQPGTTISKMAEDALGKYPGSIFVYRSPFDDKTSQLALIVVIAVLLVLLLLALLLIYLVSVRPMEREIKALQAELSENANTEQPVQHEDAPTEMPGKLSPSPVPHTRSRSASNVALNASRSLPRTSSLPGRPNSSRIPCPPQQQRQQQRAYSPPSPPEELQRQLSSTSQRQKAQPNTPWGGDRRQRDPNASSRSCISQQQGNEQNGSFYAHSSSRLRNGASQSGNPLYPR